MENGGNIFNTTNRNRSQTGGWDIWELNSSRFGWACNSSDPTFPTAAASATCTPEATTICSAAAATYPEASASASSCSQGLLFPHHTNWAYHQSPYAGDGSHYHPDPHLMCLKLGKRHYFEDTSGSGGAYNPASGSSCDRHNNLAAIGGTTLIMGKRGRPGYYGGVGPATTSTAVVTTVPRCQVEGCHVALINSKDYHRRHKVCEMHSKAPNVMVLGLEQRFCQQCSRFHIVSEFDESKRSCRRRLAGHNERRRKTTHDSGSINRTSSQVLVADKPMVDNVRFPCLSPPTARALSLLSSKYESWVSPSDLSSRSSAALRELIAENRAAILARQLVLDRHQPMDTDQDLAPESCSISNSLAPNQHQTLPDQSRCWDDRLHDTGTHITLDLMQAPSSAFGFMSSGRGKNKVEDEECSNLWNTFEGSHVV